MSANTETELRAEIVRLEKVIAALIDRAEASDEPGRNEFGIFRTTLMLEDQVRHRSHALKVALGQLEESNRALRESRAELRAIFDLMPNPLAISTPGNETLLGTSRSFAEFFGARPEDITGRSTGPDDLGIWPNGQERGRFLAALDRGGGMVSGFPLDIRRADGSTAHFVVSGRLIEVEGRKLLLKEFHDVTEATREANQLRRMAEHDALTGLPNRLLVSDRLRQALAAARRGGWQIAVCYLDLDGFKDVNDRYGHRAGDLVLKETAQRLNRVVRASDTVGRLGGDEFALILLDVAGIKECEEVFERMLQAMAVPYEVDGQSIGGVTVSIGYTLFPDDDATPDALLGHADQALYLAKRAGKNSFHRH
ncbi:MAG: sensor domain-containing diguanylate cyclase [Rhodocyclales bacterium]|nr:sensor domain-containing diguanylate cyclase [Rhodocyclales bacterium]